MIPPLSVRLTLAELIRALNDRFRRIPTPGDSGGIGGGGSTASGSGAVTQIVLAVPGTLAIQSSAAPLISLASEAQPTGLVAVVKEAPDGGVLSFKLWAAETAIGGATIPEAATEVELTGGMVKVPAGSWLRLEITGVGLDFPGADLTVELRF